jgi:hypothetical protein
MDILSGLAIVRARRAWLVIYACMERACAAVHHIKEIAIESPADA